MVLTFSEADSGRLDMLSTLYDTFLSGRGLLDLVGVGWIMRI
jgi:hypothetical protein